LVSTIDGILIGGGLFVFVQLDFSFFIGLLVVVLTFIPYLGIILCYVPAVLIAVIQYGDWQHPLYVVAVMFVVQTLESTIISPKIVGDSVGLHPLTVIISVLGWSLLLDGPIGAILAVPLSATCKVLLRRYVWEKADRGRRLVPLTMATARSLDETAERARLAREKEAAQPPAELLTPVAASPASPAPIPAPPAPATDSP
jgi:predicted PurR-regulated permease PerM